MCAERAQLLAAALIAVLALALSVAAVAASAASAPSVSIMVVGAGGTILAGPARVSAAQEDVRVAHRSCAVASATPLAALLALRHAGGPGLSLRDYARCGASPRSSAELFVTALAGERNRGQDGWEYKVGEVAGSTGAADPSGPLGNGRRIRSGEEVLWFWCNAVSGGCQRTLALAAAGSVAPGGALAVTVTGYENEGHGAPVAGAIVTLGSDFASTDARGHATLLAPSAPGHYELGATRPGLVPAFSQAIAVG